MEAQAPTSCRLGLGLVTGTLDIGSPPRGCLPGVLAPLPPGWPLPCPLASTPGNRAGGSPWARSPHTGASQQPLCKGQASSELLPHLRPFSPAVGPAARSPPALLELILLQAAPAPRSPPYRGLPGPRLNQLPPRHPLTQPSFHSSWPASLSGGVLGPSVGLAGNLSSLTRDRTRAPCSGRTEPQPLYCLGSPCNFLAHSFRQWVSCLLPDRVLTGPTHSRVPSMALAHSRCPGMFSSGQE